jgi:hypothetical protein
MADTQRDGRDGRTNGGSADRPDRGRRSGCRPGAVAGGEPGGMAARSHNGRACSGHGSGCSCWGCWTTFPSADGHRSGPLWPAPSTPRCTCGYRRTVRSAIVRHEALGHGRDQLAAGRVEEADSPPRLTVEATWGPDVGSVRIEFHLRPCIDAKRSNRAGKSLASGGRRRSALQQARAGPGLACWFGVEPPAGIEPATPSLPSMRGWFTTPCLTLRH